MKRPCVLVSSAFAVAMLGTLVGCQPDSANDPPAVVTPTALGSGSRIAGITNEHLPNHPANGASVDVTGVTFLWLDTYDETQNGKSVGDIFMQDVGSNAPYSAITAYEQTYDPANLQPQPGDVLDCSGTYDESTSVGAASFTAPGVLIQIAKPICMPRFEWLTPAPVVINPNDLNAWETGRQWTSMLVTVTDITFTSNPTNDGKGRVTAYITSDTQTTGPNEGVTMSNELFDVATWNATSNVIAQGKTVKSITGIVTWFYSYHIAPRTPDDIVVQ